MFLNVVNNQESNKAPDTAEYHPTVPPAFVIRHSSFRISPNALTLIEMLIGMAITLVMMAAVVNLFATIGASVRVRRAGMEMNSQLRIARARLFKDLAGATCEARPKLPSDDHSDGYIELIEGQYSDQDPSLLADGTDNGITSANPELNNATSLVPNNNIPLSVGGGLGDYDDILALTVRSQSEPFRGRRKILRTGGNPAEANDWIDETIESDLAEIIWYSVENPADTSLGFGEPGMRTVYRRVLLIAPWVGEINLAVIPTTSGNVINSDDANRFYQRFDISARYDSTTGTWIPNTLSDLCKRENRFARAYNSVFPHEMLLGRIRPVTQLSLDPGISPLHPFDESWKSIDPNTDYDDPDRTGDDVMLNNVLAFDIRVFDPGAPQYMWTGVLLEPGDAGWDDVHTSGTPPVIAGYGAFVDLYWNRTGTALPLNPMIPNHFFDDIALPKSMLTITSPPAASASITYDTWTYQYENDGLDQDNRDGDDNINTGADEGTNGFDDDGINGVDDAGERETSPPYDVPLRGVQVKLRIYEPDTRQIRAATVTRNMVPN